VDSELPAARETMPNGASLGATLAAARAKAKLSLADIARDTRVPQRHLTAIETDAHDSLPALPYAIGFVKSFARAVGVDAEAAAARFRAETSKTAHVPAHAALEPLDERRLPSREVVVVSLIGVALLLGGIIAYSAGVFDKAPPPPPVVITQAPAPTAAAPAPATTEPATNTVTTVPVAPAGQVAQPPSTSAALTAPPPGAPVTGAVAMTPTEDVWVKIYDRTHTVVKSGIIKAGETFTVPADPPGLMLWTGKAGVLGLTIGGKAVPPLGGPAQTVKDVSLAPADLAARSAATLAAPNAKTAQ
jgi:cytoskeleton protein RodZ